MNEGAKYFMLSFTALLPLINPPGTALELLGIIGPGDKELYRILARQIATKTAVLLVVTVIAGPYLLHVFGISLGILQLMGGLALVAMGWGMLNQENHGLSMTNLATRRVGDTNTTEYWESQVIYPLTYPVTVGPGSVTIMLTLGDQAKHLPARDGLSALVGLLLTVIVMWVLIYFSYKYAPMTEQVISPGFVQGATRVIPFLVLCIGGQIAWNGLDSLLSSAHI